MSVKVEFNGRLPPGAEEKLCINLIVLTPQEHVVHFTEEVGADAMRDLFATMPNIEDPSFIVSVVSDTFLQPHPFSHTKLLPSLRLLSLEYATRQDDDDWSPLIAYLTHQTSSGQTISLGVCGTHAPVPPEVVREIEGLVEEFNIDYEDGE